MFEALMSPYGLDPLVVFGVLSGVLGLFGYLPYIADTLKGNTQSERASWLIWSTLGTIAFFSQVYEAVTD